MSITVVLLLGLLFLGVLFWIVGKSKEQIDKMPNLPDKFDRDLIQRKLVEVQYSPNILTSYVNALMVKFQGSAEQLALRELISQKRIFSDIFEAGIIEGDLETDYDIVTDSSFRKLKKTNKKISLKESIAIKNKRIQSLKQGKSGGDTILDEYRRQKEVKKGRRDIDQEFEIDSHVEDTFKKVKIKDAIKKQGNIKIAEVNLRYAKGEITETQLKKEIEDIEDMIQDAIDKV